MLSPRPMPREEAGLSMPETIASNRASGAVSRMPVAASAACGVPIALVSLVDAERQWFKARAGVDLTQTPIDTSVCALVVRERALLVIPDLSADSRTRDFSLVAGETALRFYAGYPILTSTGAALGSVCAVDVKPRPEGLTPDQSVALEALARLAAH